MSRANAASIAKTAVGHLASTARQSFASANDDILKGKQWLSTLDNRTSKDCRIRDRLKYTLDNKPIGHKVPYLQGPGKIHFCCRSTETYILKSSEELGIKVGEIKDSSRASMDGQVPADTNYQDWFSRQSFTRQAEIVGETRARLIRDGGMSPDEFYNDRGEWLTLDQLRSRMSRHSETPGFNQHILFNQAAFGRPFLLGQAHSNYPKGTTCLFVTCSLNIIRQLVVKVVMAVAPVVVRPRLRRKSKADR